MITTINSEHRVFLVQSVGFTTRDIFCNLHDIPNVLREAFSEHDEYKVLMYWNRQWRKCSKNNLNKLFAANGVNFKVK